MNKWKCTITQQLLCTGCCRLLINRALWGESGGGHCQVILRSLFNVDTAANRWQVSWTLYGTYYLDCYIRQYACSLFANSYTSISFFTPSRGHMSPGIRKRRLSYVTHSGKRQYVTMFFFNKHTIPVITVQNTLYMITKLYILSIRQWRAVATNSLWLCPSEGQPCSAGMNGTLVI